MKKIILALSLLPSLSFAYCSAPWEDVKGSSKDQSSILCRLAVPNGWLLQKGYWADSSVVFVPDEKHEWILESNLYTQNNIQ